MRKRQWLTQKNLMSYNEILNMIKIFFFITGEMLDRYVTHYSKYIVYFFTYISDINARILHSASPKIHGYCCQNTCKSLGKPVKWNNWTLIYWIQDATNKNWKGGMFLKLGLVISMLFMFYIFMASMSLSQLNRNVRKILRPHSLKKNKT